MKTSNFQNYTFLLIFLAFGAQTLKADVVYSIPLKGQEHQIGSLLNWSTQNEVDSEVFIVEKSTDGIDYQVIGEVEALGNSNSEKGYRFLDVGVNNEQSYYRLKQLDVDGTASFSQTILLKKELSNNFMVLAMSNTLTNDIFTVSVDASIDDEVYYAIKTLKGEIVKESKMELFYGINEIMVDLRDEPEGSYFLVLKVKDEKERLVIQKVDDEIKKKENVASKKKSSGG